MTSPVSNGAPLKLHGGWRKSTRSGGGGTGNCVELKALQQGFAVRDSKNPIGPILIFDNNGLMQLAQFAKDN